MAKKIVIIDDDPGVLNLLKEALGSRGYAATAASEGTSGMALIKKEKPDLILIDILLPRRDGIEICEILRKNKRLKHIPIILMTGIYRDFDFRMLLKKTLVDDYIHKPIHVDQILAKIQKLIGG